MRTFAVIFLSVGLFVLTYALIDPQPAESRASIPADEAARADDSPPAGLSSEARTILLSNGTVRYQGPARSDEISQAYTLAQEVLVPALKTHHEKTPEMMFSRALIMPKPVDIVLEFDEVRVSLANTDRTVTGLAYVTRKQEAVATHGFRVELDLGRVILLLDDGSEMDVVAWSKSLKMFFIPSKQMDSA